MTTHRIRVGIDVGGTFTDAVAVDATTLELLGQVKVPTSHHHEDGVAHGIVEALDRLLEQTGRAAEDVAFLAHGTTQATNALLEGDVATVGLIGIGTGPGAVLTQPARLARQTRTRPGQAASARLRPCGRPRGRGPGAHRRRHRHPGRRPSPRRQRTVRRRPAGGRAGGPRSGPPARTADDGRARDHLAVRTRQADPYRRGQRRDPAAHAGHRRPRGLLHHQGRGERAADGDAVRRRGDVARRDAPAVRC